jgi:organic hydroperoxide reductase OsmC/OhrA
VGSRTATARWQPGPLRCDVEIDGFDLPVDEPVADGGTGQAPGPTGMLLTSVASCFTLALAFTAGRHGLTPSAIRVTATGRYDGLRFGRIDVVSDVDGLALDQVADLVVRAQRVCYVTNTLVRPPEIVFSTQHRPPEAG